MELIVGEAIEGVVHGMKRTLIVILALLQGCAATNPLFHVEPNPATPKSGVGYVDFFYPGTIRCHWTVTQTRPHKNIWGGAFTTEDRLDPHVYLAEMVDRPHRIVRAESKPGAQQFRLGGTAVIFGSQGKECQQVSVEVVVVESKIVPVCINLEAGSDTAAAGMPVPYQRKQAMPYYTDEVLCDGSTLLIVAAQSGQLESVRTLLAARADLNAARNDGSTALIVALENQHPDVARTLIDAHADLNAATNKGLTALASASRHGYLDIVRALLDAHVDVNAGQENGSAALDLAVENRRADVVRALIDARAKISAKAAAIMEGNDIVDLLREQKIEIQIQGSGIQRVNVRVRKLVADPVTVRIPVGSYFVAARQSAQNMVATEQRMLNLAGNDWQTISVPAACANRPRVIPGGSDTFAVERGPAQDDLASLMPVLEKSGVSYPTRQAAVWIVTDDASYSDLGKLVSESSYSPFGSGSRVIHETETARAMKICDEAGIDILRKRIWRDRQAIVRGLPAGELKTWLSNREKQ